MDLLERAQLSFKMTFNPPDGATSRQIRLYGLGAWIVGFVAIILLSSAGPVIEGLSFETDLEMIYIPCVFVAFGLMVTGCYRTLTGKKTSKHVDDYEVSPVRVIVGVVSMLLSLVIPATLMVGVLYFLQWIGMEPNEMF